MRRRDFLAIAALGVACRKPEQGWPEGWWNIDGTAPGVLPPYETPTPEFYSYSNRGGGVAPDPSPPPLRCAGGGIERRWPWDEVRALARDTHVRTLQCVGHGKPGDTAFPWRFGGASNARWQAVPVRVLLEASGVGRGGPCVVARGREGWTRAVPVALLVRDDFAVAVGMNGEALPHKHGAPARLLVPGEYGEMHVKWLESIELGVAPPDQAALSLPVHPMAWMTTPAWGAHTGRTLQVGGMTYAGLQPVASVQVAIDGGPEVAAELLDPIVPGAWRRWRASLTLPPGDHLISARAVDAAGRSAERLPPGAAWGKLGRGVIHEIAVRVA